MFRTPVCCTAYTSPSDLWLQIRWDGGRELKELTRQATQWAAENHQCRDSGGVFHLRDWVLARPEGQRLWFRGKIIGAGPADGCWLVRLIDFGDCLPMKAGADRLLPMPLEFQQPLGCAILCKLARVEPKSAPGVAWPQRDARLLEALVTMATEDLILEAEIDWLAFTSEDAPVPVELYQCSGQSINDIFGQRTGSLTKQRATGSVGCFINSWRPTQRTAPAVEAPAENDVINWKPFEGRISHVTNRGTVFVQQNEKRLSDLQAQLELWSESVDLHRFSARSLPQKDEIFAVFQLQTQPIYRYRGRLLENQGSQARVLIVDFGFELTVNWTQCARIPSRIRYEPQCRVFVPTSLHRLPRGVALETVAATSPQEAPIRVAVSPNADASDASEVPAADIVVLLGEGRQVDIVDFLLDRQSLQGQQVQAAPASLTYRSCQSDLNWDVDNIVCGTCTHVEGTHVHFRPDSMQSTADEVQAQLSQLLTSQQLQKLSPSQIQRLAASPVPVLIDRSGLGSGINSDAGSSIRQLQRGLADKFNATARTCQVAFVDTGETVAGVPVDELYAAPDELIRLATTCVRCALLTSSSDDHGNGGGTTTAPVRLQVGDKRIFIIVGIAYGAYQISILKSG